MPEHDEPIFAHIREISIRDFRGIESLDLKFIGPDEKPNKLVVLAGPNGCGKTAVLEACLIAAGCEGLIEEARGSRNIRVGARDYTVQATFCMNGQSMQIAKTSPQPGTRSLQTIVRCAYFSSLRTARFRPTRLMAIGSPRVMVVRSQEYGRLNSIRNYLKEAKLHEYMLSESRQAPSPGVNLKPYSTMVQRLDQVWQRFYAGSEQHFVVEPIGDRPEQGSDVFLRGPGEARIPLEFLSSGQLEVFGFLGWMLSSGFDRGIIVIDEPELHLDPQWHRTVLRALQILQPESQFIVATHSPEVFDAAKSYEQHFLVPEGDPRAKLWAVSHAPEGGR